MSYQTKTNNIMQDLFKFEKDTVTNYLIREVKLLSKIKKAFNYVANKLPNQAPTTDLETLNWLKGKSYNWCVIKKGDVTLIIRQYGTHFTIFTKLAKKDKHFDGEDELDYFEINKYGCFIFHSDSTLLSDKESDALCDDRFLDLNKSISQIIELVSKDKTQFWNPYTLERPKHVIVESVYNSENISSVDKIIFASEELFQLNLVLFSEIDVIDKIKEFKVGDNFGKDFHGDVTINKIKTEVVDDYYHAVGIETIDSNGKKDFKDVYCLTRYYYENLFPKENLQK